ncbi:MAG: hypothetical protein ABI947_28955 [Chloroflexota bacterium]
MVKVANAAFGEGSDQAQGWLDQFWPALYEGHLARGMAALRTVSDLAPKAIANARHYFAANRTRLHYSTFRAVSRCSTTCLTTFARTLFRF